jgi:regulator of protease activity HflC (stomatin/prohibitin superfamily)
LELDAVFEAKEELALSVQNALAEIMTSYGYQIVQVLITDLDPDQRVKNAMNEINSSKRLKFAVCAQCCWRNRSRHYGSSDMPVLTNN